MQLTLLELVEKYVEHLKADGKAKATIMAYGKDIEQMAQFMAKKGKAQPQEITSEDIDEFKDLLKKQRFSSKTISRKINSIKSFFRYLRAEGIITINPAEVITHPKYETLPPRILSRMEYRALRDACRGDVRMFAVVELLLQTGLRISELAFLQVQDVDFDRNVLTIQPQNSRDGRKVPMNQAAKEALQKYMQIRPRSREKTVFITKNCRPFLVRNIRTAIDRYFHLAGINKAKVNDLRHTFIVEQLKAGTPLVYISQLVGHKRITTTEKYLKLIEAPEMTPNVQIEEL
jgi:integrase/recombinase XerC